MGNVRGTCFIRMLVLFIGMVEMDKMNGELCTWPVYLDGCNECLTIHKDGCAIYSQEEGHVHVLLIRQN